MTMMRPTVLLLAISTIISFTANVSGYTLPSLPSALHQRSSYFVGRDVYHSTPSTPAVVGPSGGRSKIDMKKGKSNLPPGMRSQYARAQEMEQYRKAMIDGQNFKSTADGGDGMPVFQLFVRTGLKNVWYPCGSFKGDEKSAALCQNYASNGLLAGISKKQLDAGVGGSLYRDLKRLEESIVRGYPQLKKERGKLEYGYKLSYEGLSKEQQKINVVEVKEQKGFFDGLKGMFGGK